MPLFYMSVFSKIMVVKLLSPHPFLIRMNGLNNFDILYLNMHLIFF